jgi:hypothetical protein
MVYHRKVGVSRPLEEGSCEKIQSWMGKALFVVQGSEKFAPPKSAGHFRSPNRSPDFRKGTPARRIKTQVNTRKFSIGTTLVQ